MEPSLAVRYRPHRLEEMVSQPQAVIPLQRMIRDGRLPQTMLFYGPKGTGKTTLGRLVGAALNCEAEISIRPCGLCDGCIAVQQDRSLGMLEVDGASHGGVAEIRRLRESVIYSSGASHRLLLLDEAQSMSSAANNALLALLEQPPPDLTIILLTTEPDKLLETVRSRMTRLELLPVVQEDLFARLSYIAAQEGIQAEEDLLKLLAQQSDGELRSTLNELDFIGRTKIATLREYEEVRGDQDRGPLLWAAILSGSKEKTHEIFEQHFRRVGNPTLLVNALINTLDEIQILTENPEALKEMPVQRRLVRLALSKKLGKVAILRCQQLLWELQRSTVAGWDARIMLRLVSSMLIELLTSALSTPAQPAKPQAKMILKDMA